MTEELDATLPLPIIYRDDCLIAVNKPAGLPVHRDEFSPRGQVVCLQVLRDQIGREVHPLHRLDAATSGVLLFSDQKSVLSTMMQQFMHRRISKTYHAVTRGWLKSPIVCDLPVNKDGAPQEARTFFRPLQYLEMPWPNERFGQSRYTFLEAKPHTGRFHQIRRHANYLAIPLVGDTKHGDSEHNRLWRRERGCHRLLLHASAIAFEHPVTGELLTIECDLPDDYRTQLEELPWKLRSFA